MKLLTPLSLALIALTACSTEDPVQPAPSSDTAALDRFYSAQEPAGAKPVGEVRASAKDGEHVVLVGDVGGAAQVFVDGAAIFTLVDPGLESCAGDGMGCQTPWDYCCVDPAAIREGSATIELRDGEQPVGVSPQGFHGLDHLKTVVVEGVAERDAAGNLIVAAEKVHVRP